MPIGRLQKVKTKEKNHIFSYRSGRGRLQQVVAYKRYVPNIVIWLGNVWYFGTELTSRWGEMVAYGRCKFDCIDLYWKVKVMS